MGECAGPVIVDNMRVQHASRYPQQDEHNAQDRDEDFVIGWARTMIPVGQHFTLPLASPWPTTGTR